MSYVKAREAAQAQPQSDIDSLLCTWGGGCRNRWSCDFGRGKLCSEHDAYAQRNSMTREPRGKPEPRPIASALPVPSRPAARPFAEVDDEEQPF